MIIINRFHKSNSKLNNVMCITESINIDSYQANLKVFIQYFRTTQNRHYTSVTKKGSTYYHCNNNQIKETNLTHQINHAYIIFYKFENLYKITYKMPDYRVQPL